MLDLIAKRNLANVELVLGGERDPRLPEVAVDLVLIANAYHEFSEPEAILAVVRRRLKRDGRLVVLEYAKENSHVPVSDLHKMSIDEIRSEIEPVGFQLDRVLDILPMQHGLIFTKQP
jgi:ubiquinone/menaquinone biosynthesis C-methylase UbiE